MNEANSHKAFDGRRIIISKERWRHIIIRHPEVGNDVALLSKGLSNPTEVYENGRGGIHSILQIDENHFLVVIYEATNDEGFVRTAYITNMKRKERRYRGLQSLKPS